MPVLNSISFVCKYSDGVKLYKKKKKIVSGSVSSMQAVQGLACTSELPSVAVKEPLTTETGPTTTFVFLFKQKLLVSEKYAHKVAVVPLKVKDNIVNIFISILIDSV